MIYRPSNICCRAMCTNVQHLPSLGLVKTRLAFIILRRCILQVYPHLQNIGTFVGELPRYYIITIQEICLRGQYHVAALLVIHTVQIIS